MATWPFSAAIAASSTPARNGPTSASSPSDHSTVTPVISRGAAGSASSSSSSRYSRFRNSKRRKNSLIPARSGGAATRLFTSTSSGRARSMVARVFDRPASSAGGASGSPPFSPRTAGAGAPGLPPPLLARHGGQVRQDALERAEPDQKVGGGLVADARHARDVVRGVALETDEVGHEPRLDAVAGHDPVRGVDVDLGDPAR